MKAFLLAGLLGLAGCAAPAEKQPAAVPPAEDPTHAAVAAYLKQTLDDPASYQPAQWGKPTPWQQRDADALASAKPLRFAKEDYEQAKRHLRARSAYGQQLFDEAVASSKRYQRQGDSLLHSTDTTRLGAVITHAYRAKNKMGALQLDSAQFIVYKSGKVEPL